MLLPQRGPVLLVGLVGHKERMFYEYERNTVLFSICKIRLASFSNFSYGEM